jgi:hypothetical protein
MPEIVFENNLNMLQMGKYQTDVNLYPLLY